jgi:predicted ATPase
MKEKPYLREIELRRECVENFDTYPFCIPGVKNLRSLKFHPDVTFLVGENGTGKSIMDEPEAALSPSRQMAALSAIHGLVEQNSQFIIATHSPILLAYPRAWIYQLDEEGIKKIEYEETEHYSVTRQFLNGYQQMLEILMNRDDCH